MKKVHYQQKTHSTIWGFIGLLSILMLCETGCDNNTGGGTSETIMKKNDLVADTIIYPVRIKNIDTTDMWADTRLQKLDRKKLVDQIFESVYNGKAKAYNYLSDREMSIDEIKELESSGELLRDNVVELEFREKWWYDQQKVVFKKEVISVLVAYAVYDEFNEFSRLKAAFYVKTAK